MSRPNDLDSALAVECPKCKAQPSRRCSMGGNEHSKPHAARVSAAKLTTATR